MEIQQGIKEFLIEIEVRKYTPRTIRGYRNNLNLFLRFCTEHEIAAIENVTLATVKQFTRAMTASKKKGTYINGILKGVKSRGGAPLLSEDQPSRLPVSVRRQRIRA